MTSLQSLFSPIKRHRELRKQRKGGIAKARIKRKCLNCLDKLVDLLENDNNDSINYMDTLGHIAALQTIFSIELEFVTDEIKFLKQKVTDD